MKLLLQLKLQCQRKVLLNLLRKFPRLLKPFQNLRWKLLLQPKLPRRLPKFRHPAKQFLPQLRLRLFQKRLRQLKKFHRRPNQIRSSGRESALISKINKNEPTDVGCCKFIAFFNPLPC